MLKILSSRLGMIVSAFTIVGLTATAWINLGMPLPASAEDVRKLTKGQAQIGIELYKDREKDLRKERYRLQWETQKAKQKNAPASQTQLMDEQTEELKVDLEDARLKRLWYEQQLINAEK